MRREPGTYALLLCSRDSAEIEIGRWGRLAVEPGYYVYVGSAFGPGGVRARVSRHLRSNKIRHWHVDYLRERTIPIRVWCSYAPRRLEHRWAQALGRMPGAAAVKGFGCSDCRCPAHLFAMAAPPDATVFAIAAGGAVESWAVDDAGLNRPYAATPDQCPPCGGAQSSKRAATR